jgi:hypothetical protein
MSAARPQVSILVPAFNEAAILQANLTLVCDYMERLEGGPSWELVVVDDGSVDETGELAQAFARTRPNVRVFHHPMNFRLGQALRTGFNQCRGETIVTFDIDLSYDPEHIGRLLERMRATRAKIVVASPYMKGGKTSDVPFLRRMLSRWGNRFLALSARGVSPSGDIATLTGMVRAYDGPFIRSLNLKTMGTEINTEIIHKALILGARIEEIPAHLDWGPQKAAAAGRVSSMRIRKGIVTSLLAAFIIRPFAFFIIPGLALALVSAYVLAWIAFHVFTHYRELSATGRHFDFVFSAALAESFQQAPHAFIVGGITLLLSVQLFSLGVLALQFKQYFEELFHFGTRVFTQVRDIERRLDQLAGDEDQGDQGRSGDSRPSE